MSALSKDIWSISSDGINSKYEKCRNITEEIYKRINITFEIKKLEMAVQSDKSEHSDQIDSNELSNETDLFACDKSDSISSSTEAEKPTATCEKFINNNNNNNEETTTKKATTVQKRPRKRFRKRVKKRQSKTTRSDTEGSSDEAVPLSRIVEDSKCIFSEQCVKSDSPDYVMGVPNIVILTRDLKQKTRSNINMKLQTVNPCDKYEQSTEDRKPKEQKTKLRLAVSKDKTGQDWKHCTICSLTFKGDKRLRQHISTHVTNSDEKKKPSKPERAIKTSSNG